MNYLDEKGPKVREVLRCAMIVVRGCTANCTCSDCLDLSKACMDLRDCDRQHEKDMKEKEDKVDPQYDNTLVIVQVMAGIGRPKPNDYNLFIDGKPRGTLFQNLDIKNAYIVSITLRVEDSDGNMVTGLVPDKIAAVGWMMKKGLIKEDCTIMAPEGWV